MNEIWDSIVVGGGAAGLSAALVLGRARRRTLVVDAGRQSNRPAHGIGGLLGHDGRSPANLYALGHEELTKYPSVEVRHGTIVSAKPDDAGYVVTLDDGSVATTRTVLLAAGMDYVYADVDGLAERWGHSVFHCPFCHGWEARDGRLAVLDSDPTTALHRAQLLRNWSDDVVLLTNGPTELTAADRAALGALGVPIDERPVASVRGDGNELSAVVFADGSSMERDGLLVAVELRQRDDLAAQLGVPLAPTPLSAEALAADPLGATAVPGVFVAGDVVAGMPSVANAIAAGSIAAASIVRHLVT